MLHKYYFEILLFINSVIYDGPMFVDTIEKLLSRRILKGTWLSINICAIILLKPNKSETLIQGNPSFAIAFSHSECVSSKRFGGGEVWLLVGFRKNGRINKIINVKHTLHCKKGITFIKKWKM